jgi:hypothetical protein
MQHAAGGAGGRRAAGSVPGRNGTGGDGNIRDGRDAPLRRANGDVGAHCDAAALADTDADRHVHWNGHGHAYRDPHGHGIPHGNPHKHADGQSHCYRHSHAPPHARTGERRGV